MFNCYQPKVDVATGKLVGVESLVRWRHPQDGVVYPDQFIGVAEEHGLIDDLTRLIMSMALFQASRWHATGLPLLVSVNVSMDNLNRVDMADYVLAELDRTGFPPTLLILEVTESRVMRDMLASLDVLTRLKLKHIGLSIDDCGTGHSSLAQLRDMPFDELKMDRSFVHGAAANETLVGIFEGSVAIGYQLGMKVVAEGVEDDVDWNFLRSYHCHLAQGYLISKPLLPDDLVAWHKEWLVKHAGFANPPAGKTGQGREG